MPCYPGTEVQGSIHGAGGVDIMLFTATGAPRLGPEP